MARSGILPNKSTILSFVVCKIWAEKYNGMKELSSGAKELTGVQKIWLMMQKNQKKSWKIVVSSKQFLHRFHFMQLVSSYMLLIQGFVAPPSNFCILICLFLFFFCISIWHFFTVRLGSVAYSIKKIYSFEILALPSLTRSLQSIWFRVPDNGIDASTDIAPNRLNRPLGVSSTQFLHSFHFTPPVSSSHCQIHWLNQTLF